MSKNKRQPKKFNRPKNYKDQHAIKHDNQKGANQSKPTYLVSKNNRPAYQNDYDDHRHLSDKNPYHNQSLLIQKAILDTLKYRQIFNYPMTYHQLWTYLIVSPTPSTDASLKPSDFNRELEILVAQKKVVHQHNLYSLGKIDCSEIEKRKVHSANLLAKASQIAGYLKHIPWLEMIAVTGSVAAFNADDKADIDLFIVTKSNRLFLSRLFVVIVLKVLRVYWDAKNPAGTVCPNILVTSDNLSWDEKDRNLYVDNEISLLYPLYYKNNCYFDFLKQNDWVKDYLPNFFKPNQHNQDNIIKPGTSSDLIKTHGHNFVDLFEIPARKIQLDYMSKKRTTEVVKNNFIHFNIHDSAPTILRKFQTS